MTLRSTLAAASGAGLLAILPAFAPAIAQETVTIEEVVVVQEDRERESPREESADRIPVERLRRELDEMRRALEAERAARRHVEELLASIIVQEPRGRGERDEARQADRRGRAELREGRIEQIEVELRDDGRPEGVERGRRDGPGEVEVAEARVRAARTRLEAAEVRLDVAGGRLALIERRLATGTIPESEQFDGRLAVAEAQAQLDEARAQLVEAEFGLARVRRGAEGDGDDRADGKEDGEEFEVEDVLDSADRIIDLIRRFDERHEGDDDARERDDREPGRNEGTIDEVIETADDIMNLIQRFRRDRVGR